MTTEELDKLIDSYAWRVVDDMEMSDLCRIVAESIVQNFDNESEEYIVNQIKKYYPDLLEDV